MNTRTCVLAILTLVFGLAVSGCASSPPAQFITLHPVLGTAVPVTQTTPVIRIDRINLPTALDRPYLVTASSPTTREVSNIYRWIAPLNGLIRTSLKQDLSSRTTSRAQSSDNKTLGLTIDIHSFMANSDSQVLLDADWRASHPQEGHDATVASGSARILTQANSSSGSDIAAAMSEALAQFAHRIAARISSRPPNRQ